MKKYTYLIVLFIVFGCKKEDSIIPTYININTITLNENDVTTNIIDAWVYVDDQLQGVYELPAIFPVLALGEHNVRVRAGIKSNGIASSRIAYPFYSSFFDTLMFIEDQITTITPTVSYLDDVDFFLEDFEGAGMDLEITAISDTALLEFTDSSGNQYGGGILNDSLFTFEIATDELLDLPQSGAPVFLELDYKSNTQFLVGVYTNYSQSVVQKDLLWINPKEDWNKIYVNLTQTISEGINATSFKVFIGMRRDHNLNINEVYFDNLKIVY